MNGSLWPALGTAAWLGVLAAISPCPLTTNVAAISYLGKRMASPAAVLLGGTLYTLGRAAAYVGVAVVVLAGLRAVPAVSHFVQGYINQALGPLLIIVGVFLLELIKLPVGRGAAAGAGQKVARWGYAGDFLLGVLFGVSFCPVTAALFFGTLIPLAVAADSRILVPAVFGVGTGAPVLAFAFLLAFGARSLAAAFNKVSRVEKWARRVTGVVFLGVGVYYCLRYIFGVL
jgi:cytochrome c biogenesis protein CcdA